SADAEKAFDRGMAAIRENKNEDAIAIFKDIVAKDPKDHLAWTMLGTIYYSDKKYDDASPAFIKALELKPDFTLARVNMGKMEISQKNYEKAVESLTKAVELEPKSADANHYLGEAYLQMKKGSLAVGFLNKALEIAPVQKADIHLRLAALYNAANLKDRAAAEYKAFIAKVPNHADKSKFEQYIKDNTPK
ncbi:MAG TPA: tetratricopeptide repeat protein, partial [Pyrinomonadaceae bacterium]|nr:tetratricopeptide repeat protein [Pyrinomonadaceae bacterium]